MLSIWIISEEKIDLEDIRQQWDIYDESLGTKKAYWNFENEIVVEMDIDYFFFSDIDRDLYLSYDDDEIKQFGFKTPHLYDLVYHNFEGLVKFLKQTDFGTNVKIDDEFGHFRTIDEFIFHGDPQQYFTGINS